MIGSKGDIYTVTFDYSEKITVHCSCPSRTLCHHIRECIANNEAEFMESQNEPFFKMYNQILQDEGICEQANKQLKKTKTIFSKEFVR